MMKVTIIIDDSLVILNGDPCFDVDFGSCNIPKNTHALQWDGVSGWIEEKGSNNVQISELPEWANLCIGLWHEREPPIELPAEDLIRFKRDGLLSYTDWVIAKAVEQACVGSIDPIIAPEWLAYRQSLRDVTQQAGFPNDVAWPVKPT